MKRIILILVFIVGFGIFSYPIVSNYFSTKAHVSAVEEYRETVKELDESSIIKEREKADQHNEKLESAQLDFVDPFGDNNDSEEEREGNKSYYDALNIGPAIGSLDIPKLNVNLPMYHGTSDDVLSRGVGHLENSSLPTGKAGTHSVLTAHRGLPSSKLFRDLDQIDEGDQFFIEVLDEIYAYEVFDIDIVLPHETDWLQMNNDEELVTLLTCEPYMINTHRMLVKGKRVPYDPEAMEVALADQPEKPFPWYIVAGSLSLLMLIVLIIKQRKARKNDADV